MGSSTMCRLAQEAEHARVEAEVLDGVQDAAGAADHAVAAALGQPAGEDLEDRAPLGRAGLQGGLEHRELVLVGEERGRRHVHRQPEVRSIHSELPRTFVRAGHTSGRGIRVAPREMGHAGMLPRILVTLTISRGLFVR